MKTTSLKSLFCFVMVAIFAIIPAQIPVAYAAAEGGVNIGLHVGKKVDVALAIGPTQVDYATFEDDLRAKLSAKNPPIPKNDLHITAAKSVSANSTSEFTWWTYDHTRSSTGNTYQGKAYDGVQNVSDDKHTYIEPMKLSSSPPTTGSGSKDYYLSVPAGQQGTVPPYNRDYTTTATPRHPFNDNLYHLSTNESGSTFDAYGYDHFGYKDWRYLPNDQATKKTFEFSVEDLAAFDAADGLGFLFNTDIRGSYTEKSQKINGYMVFFKYQTTGGDMQGKAVGMQIYKLTDVSAYDLHNFENTSGSNTLLDQSGNSVSSTSTMFPGFKRIAYSTIYSNAHKYRRIKIEAKPSEVKVWYNGSGSDRSVLSKPIAKDAAPVSWATTGDSVGGAKTNVLSIPLDTNVIKSYGFGPFASYFLHTCARPTHFQMQNLTMDVERVRMLPEVVREPEWRDDTLKFLVNLNEEPIDDFSSGSITSELLARLTTDDIYYLGWCSKMNAGASQGFLDKYDLKGEIINIDELGGAGKQGQENYERQLQRIADYIYDRWYQPNPGDVVLTTDVVRLDVAGVPATGTDDPEWPNGKWKIIHATDGFDSPEGIYADSGKLVPDLAPDFSLPGTYDIYYKNSLVKTIIAHRKPEASFNVTLAGNVPSFTDVSYDPDDSKPGDLQSGLQTNLTKWQYFDSAVDTVPHDGLPQSLVDGHIYVVFLTVTDKYGASTEVARQISVTSSGTGGDNSPALLPYANFSLAPSSILKDVGNQEITVTDMSYDIRNDPITVYNWVLTNQDTGAVVTDLGNGKSMGSGVSDVSLLPYGNYKLSLTVTSKNGTSVATAHFFSVIADTIAPKATANPQTASVTVNTDITLSFSDLGGAGLNSQKVIVTNSTARPTGDAGWTGTSTSSQRSVTINKVGNNYIHWIATDNAGNEGYGVFGPYTLNKQNTQVTLSASPAAPIIYGESTTFTAEITAQENTYDASARVYFYDGATVMGGAPVTGGKAEFTFTLGNAGTRNIRAVFQGDSTHNLSEQSMAYQVLPSDDVNIVVAPVVDRAYDATPYAVDGNVRCKTSGGADVSYKLSYVGISGTVYGPSASAPTAAGAYKVTATTDDSNYNVKTADAAFSIEKLTPAIRVVTDVASAPAFGNVKMIAELTGVCDEPDGDVVFYVDGDAVDTAVAIEYTDDGQGSGAKATTDVWENLKAGDHTLSAAYIPSANSNYFGARSSEITFNVNKVNQSTMAFTDGSSLIKTYGDTGFTLVADNAAGKSAADVVYSVVSNDDVISVNASTGEADILKAGGPAVVRAFRDGDSNYNPAETLIEVEVLPAYATIDIADIPNKVYDGDAIATPAVTTAGVSGESPAYILSYTGTVAGNGSAYGPTGMPPNEVGLYFATATTDDRNYHVVTATKSFEIVRRTVKVNLSASTDKASAFDDIVLTAILTKTLSGADPLGVVEFRRDSELVASVPVSHIGGTFSASTDMWTSAQAGTYDLSATYLPAQADVYNSATDSIENYEVSKINQSGLSFNKGEKVTVTYGDKPFNCIAAGAGAALSAGDISYRLKSGSDVVGFTNSVVTIKKPGTAVVEAVKAGDINYNDIKTTLTIHVLPNPDALISAGTQTDKVYDGQPFAATGVISSGAGGVAIPYEVTYTGRGDTNYGPASTPPSDAGEYDLVVTTADENYEAREDRAVFEISKRELPVTLSAKVAKGEIKEDTAAAAFDTVVLRAEIADYIEAPEGIVRFKIDGKTVAEETVVNSGDAYAEFEWGNVSGGAYNIMAEYIPPYSGNYLGGTDEMKKYSVNKIDQSGLEFEDGSKVVKTYKDNDFKIKAVGVGSALSTGDITYEVVSGADAFAFDAETGTVHIIAAGEGEIKAVKTGDTNYNRMEALITISILQAENTLSLKMPAEISFGSPVVPVVTNESNGDLIYEYEGTDGTSYGASESAPAEIGTYQLTVTSAETANYKSAAATCHFTIIPCDCKLVNVSVGDGVIHIPASEFEGSFVPVATYEIDHCDAHGDVVAGSFGFEDPSYGAKVIGTGSSVRIVAGDDAAGKTLTLKYTATHVETGLSVTATAKIEVLKDKMEDVPVPGNPINGAAYKIYNKNNGGDVSVGIISILDGDSGVAVYYKGKQIEEGKYYTVTDGSLVLTQAMLNILPVGNNDIMIVSGSNMETLTVGVDKGNVNVVVEEKSAIWNHCLCVDPDEVATKALTSDEQKSIGEGYDYSLKLVLSDDVRREDKQLIAGSAGAATSYVDLALYKSRAGTKDVRLQEVSAPIDLSIMIPASLEGYDRYELVMAYHTGAGVNVKNIPFKLANGSEMQNMFSCAGEHKGTVLLCSGVDANQSKWMKDFAKPNAFSCAGVNQTSAGSGNGSFEFAVSEVDATLGIIAYDDNDGGAGDGGGNGDDGGAGDGGGNGDGGGTGNNGETGDMSGADGLDDSWDSLVDMDPDGKGSGDGNGHHDATGNVSDSKTSGTGGDRDEGSGYIADGASDASGGRSDFAAEWNKGLLSDLDGIVDDEPTYFKEFKYKGGEGKPGGNRNSALLFGSFTDSANWSLAGMLFAILGAFLSLTNIMEIVRRRRGDGEKLAALKSSRSRSNGFRKTFGNKADRRKDRHDFLLSVADVTTIISGAATTAVWLITNDLSKPMALINNTTPIVTALFAVSLTLKFFGAYKIMGKIDI